MAQAQVVEIMAPAEGVGEEALGLWDRASLWLQGVGIDLSGLLPDVDWKVIVLPLALMGLFVLFMMDQTGHG